MIIWLTEEQIENLKSLHEEAVKNFEIGKPGIIFAQVKPVNGHMVVRYIEDEMAAKIQEIIGEQPLGKTC